MGLQLHGNREDVVAGGGFDEAVRACVEFAARSMRVDVQNPTQAGGDWFDLIRSMRGATGLILELDVLQHLVQHPDPFEMCAGDTSGPPSDELEIVSEGPSINRPWTVSMLDRVEGVTDVTGVWVAVTPPDVDVEPTVKDFLTLSSLGSDFQRAVTLAQSVFAPATHIGVTLEEDPEEEDAPPTVVFRPSTGLGIDEFRAARKAFYRTLRNAGATRLCGCLAVVRE
jgi:hypothetical protein